MTGVNKRVRDALEDSEGAALSIGEVMARADIDKRLAGDVSSALYKLLASGVVLSEIGPSSSNLGRRFVKRYSGKSLREAFTQDAAFWNDVQRKAMQLDKKINH